MRLAVTTGGKIQQIKVATNHLATLDERVWFLLNRHLNEASEQKYAVIEASI